MFANHMKTVVWHVGKSDNGLRHLVFWGDDKNNWLLYFGNDENCMGDEVKTTYNNHHIFPLSHYKKFYGYIYIVNGLFLGLRRECDLQFPPRQREKLRTNSYENCGTRDNRLKLKAKYTKSVIVHTLKNATVKRRRNCHDRWTGSR